MEDSQNNIDETNEPKKFEVEKGEHIRSKPKVSSLAWTMWGIMCAWCGFFCLYIILVFFSQPVSKWNTVSDYSATKRAIPMCIHWVGGVIILLIGPFQLLPQIRARRLNAHRWMGRTYLLATMTTCLAGIIYISINGTVGGVVMDVPFYINGFLFLFCGSCAYYYVRRKKILLHREWAIRTFAMGISSAFYRILISPLFFSSIVGSTAWISNELGNTWLNVASWFFYFPNLLVCELYFYYKWERGLFSYTAKYFNN